MTGSILTDFSYTLPFRRLLFTEPEAQTRKEARMSLSSVSGSSFPRPLTEEEENALLEFSALGDPVSRNRLVEHNLRLVAHIAKKYTGNERSFDDLISIGTIGLIKAVDTYKRGKSVRLATYAAKCIENEILMYIRSSKKLRSEVSLNEPLGTDKDGNEISFNDILGTDDTSIVDDLDYQFQVKKLCETFSSVACNSWHIMYYRNLASDKAVK